MASYNASKRTFHEARYPSRHAVLVLEAVPLLSHYDVPR